MPLRSANGSHDQRRHHSRGRLYYGYDSSPAPEPPPDAAANAADKPATAPARVPRGGSCTQTCSRMKEKPRESLQVLQCRRNLASDGTSQRCRQHLPEVSPTSSRRRKPPKPSCLWDLCAVVVGGRVHGWQPTSREGTRGAEVQILVSRGICNRRRMRLRLTRGAVTAPCLGRGGR